MIIDIDTLAHSDTDAFTHTYTNTAANTNADSYNDTYTNTVLRRMYQSK